MRAWDEWLDFCKKKCSIADFFGNSSEIKQLFQTELALFSLYELKETIDTLPLYLSGYRLCSNDQQHKKMVLLKVRLPFLSSAKTWNELLQWYFNLKKEIRLFECEQPTDLVILNPNCIYDLNRLETYQHTLLNSPKHESQIKPIDQPGTYEARTSSQYIYQYKVTPDLLEKTEVEEILCHRNREPIEVSLSDLETAAKEMQDLDPKRNWEDRWKRINMKMIRDGVLGSQNIFDINGVFHLVGMMSSGKSTFIDILIYHLVRKQDKHITLVMQTVVDSLNKAAFFNKLGIEAISIRGRDRNSHIEKYGRAHKKDLDPKNLFLMYDTDLYPENDETVQGMNVLSGACPISYELLAQGDSLFRPGQEPCDDFYKLSVKAGLNRKKRVKQERFLCPLRFKCPVHRDKRQLKSAKVWIVNSSSFLQTLAPVELTAKKMTIAEAVYQRSDLLIVDEADRVQTEWDQKLVPITDLYSDDKSLVKSLQRKLSDLQPGQLFEEYAYLDTKYNILNSYTGNLIRLFFQDPYLTKWASNPLNNNKMYADLAKSFAMPLNGRKHNKKIKTHLLREFKKFYSNPSNELHPLSGIIANSKLSEYHLPLMQEKLRKWVNKHLDWPLEEKENEMQLIRKLQASLLITFTDHSLQSLMKQLKRHPELGSYFSYTNDFFQRIIPDSPIGRIIGYRYEEKENPILQFWQSFGMGRWILLNYHHLFYELDGFKGPHVLYTSATSWAPGSPQYHLFVPPNAILVPPEKESNAILKSSFNFLPKHNEKGERIHVSGLRDEKRLDHLRLIARQLVQDGNFSEELNSWKESDRRILIIVGSYEEAKTVTYEINRLNALPGQAVCMISDEEAEYEPLTETHCIRRGEIENFSNTDFDILVAPLKAIERGYNIVNDAGEAVLGSVYFLVRPAHSPTNLYPLIMGVYHRVMKETSTKFSPHRLKELRHEWRKEWFTRIQCTNDSLKNIPDHWYEEQIWDQFVTVWQTIGRLVRGGVECRAYFVDAAFDPEKGRQILKDWHRILKQYIESQNQTDKSLAELLFLPAYRAFQRMEEQYDHRFLKHSNP